MYYMIQFVHFSLIFVIKSLYIGFHNTFLCKITEFKLKTF